MFQRKNPQGRDPHLKWQYLAIKAGERFQFWKAGHPVGVWLHWQAQSKPCRAKLTDNAVSCPLCLAKLPPTWRAYLPVYTKHKEKRVIIYAEKYHEIAEAIPIHSPMIAARGKGGRDPVVIHPIEGGDNALSWVGNPPPPQDIRPCLLMLWGDKELADVVAKQFEDAPESVREILAAPEAGTPAKRRPDRTPEEEAEAMRKARGRLRSQLPPTPGDASPPPEDKPERNGHHR